MDNLPDRLSTVIDTSNDLDTGDRDGRILVYQLGDESSLEFVIPFLDLGAGHVIRKELLDLPTVVFAGVKPPHPLEPKICLRVRSVPGPDGRREEARPARALWQAIQNACANIDAISEAFSEARDSFDVSSGRAGPAGRAPAPQAPGPEDYQYDYAEGQGDSWGQGGQYDYDSAGWTGAGSGAGGGAADDAVGGLGGVGGGGTGDGGFGMGGGEMYGF